MQIQTANLFHCIAHNLQKGHGNGIAVNDKPGEDIQYHQINRNGYRGQNGKQLGKGLRHLFIDFHEITARYYTLDICFLDIQRLIGKIAVEIGMVLMQ